MKKTISLIAALMVVSSAAVAQGFRPGDPGTANTTDPNSAPVANPHRQTNGFGKFDPAGRANTSDPGSTRSGATNGAGKPVASPRRR